MNDRLKLSAVFFYEVHEIISMHWSGGNKIMPNKGASFETSR